MSYLVVSEEGVTEEDHIVETITSAYFTNKHDTSAIISQSDIFDGIHPEVIPADTDVNRLEYALTCAKIAYDNVID